MAKKARKTVQVNFRLEEELRDQMQEVCEELGISMSAAFQLFATAVARGRCIPLDLDLNRRPQVTYAMVGLDGEKG